LERKGNALSEFQEQINVYRKQGLRKNAMELVKNL